MSKISFNNKNNLFFKELKQKVDEYFAANELKSTGNWKLYGKTAVLFSCALGIYSLIMFVEHQVWVSFLLFALLGLNFASIGFNVMHDGGHGSYSDKKWINKMMAYSLNALGGSSFLWNVKHNLNHHSYTNIEGMDDDIDIRPWIRSNEGQPHLWFHKYQHVYWVFFYCWTYVFWIFFGDFKKYFTGKVSDMKFKSMSVRQHIVFWLSKLAYIFFVIVLPIFELGFWEAFLGFIVLGAICGLTLGIVFQMAHLVEETEFPVACQTTNKIEQEWAVHQVETTANFATQSRIVSWFTGGLNFQVEHHLFPKISHVHYPAISKLVKETCDQFKIKYNEYPNVLSALASHVMHLKNVGVAQ